jgi:cysteinyl-tRNA synthetase
MTQVLPGDKTQTQNDRFPAEVLALLDERQAARKAKDYARADQIREQLKGLGYAIEDSRQGAKLKKL